MKHLIAASLCLASVGAASAQEPINRYNIQNMTCNQVQSIVNQQGAAILRYPSPSGSGRILYDRFVNNPAVCFAEEGHPVRRTIPTADTRSCPAIACKPGPPECDDMDFGLSLYPCFGN